MPTCFNCPTLSVLFCTVCAAAPASAALTAHASISDMRITVIDLTPDDGKQAGFSIAGYGANLVTRLETAGHSDFDSDSPAAGMPGRAEVSAPGMRTATFTSGAIGELISDSYLGASAISLSAEGSQNWRLDLLPNSGLVIRGSMTVEALWTPQPYASEYFAEGAAYMTFAAEGSPPFEVAHVYRISGSNAAQEVRESEDYMYVYENAGDAAMPVYFNGGAWVHGRAIVSAVPEPGALPMLLIGIALLPGWRRRGAASRPCKETP